MKQKLQQTTVREFFNNLTAKQRKEFIQNVGLLSGLKPNQFYYRLRHNSWSRTELAMLNQLMSGMGFVVFFPNILMPTICYPQTIDDEEKDKNLDKE